MDQYAPLFPTPTIGTKWTCSTNKLVSKNNPARDHKVKKKRYSGGKHTRYSPYNKEETAMMMEPLNRKVEKRGYVFNNRRGMLRGIHVLRINNKVHISLCCCIFQEFESHHQEDSFFNSELIVYVAESVRTENVRKRRLKQ